MMNTDPNYSIRIFIRCKPKDKSRRVSVRLRIWISREKKIYTVSTGVRIPYNDTLAFKSNGILNKRRPCSDKSKELIGRLIISANYICARIMVDYHMRPLDWLSSAILKDLIVNHEPTMPKGVERQLLYY